MKGQKYTWLFGSIYLLSTADNLKEFEAFAKLVMAFFAISSTVSFGLFIYSLVYTYKLGKKGQNPPLDSISIL